MKCFVLFVGLVFVLGLSFNATAEFDMVESGDYALSGVGVAVSLPDTSLAPGDTLSVPVVIGDVTGLGVISAEMSISYDSDVVTALDATTSGTLAESWMDTSHVVEGVGTSVDTLKIAMATAVDTLVGAGNLVFIRFAVSESAAPGDTSALSFEEFVFNEGDPAAVTQDGSVTIARMYGDVTNNGAVTAYDAAWILQHTVGMRMLTGADSVAADVSGVEGITAYDASLVLQYVVGLIERFPVEEGGLPKFVSGRREVHLGSAEALSDGSFVVPVIIDEMEGVLSGQIELSFDRRDFRAIQVVKSDRTEEYLFAAKISDDKVKLSFAGAESKQGGGRIATIRFDLSAVTPAQAGRMGGGSDGMAGITLRRVQLNEGRFAVSLPSAQVASEVPTAYRLAQNVPNPFNANTLIRVQLPREDRVTLRVYNLSGQVVRTLVDSRVEAGPWNVLWDGKDEKGREVSSGVYFYRLAVDGSRWTKTMKMIVLR